MARTAVRAALLPIPVERIQQRIFLVRGQKVMVDADLADLYHVGTSTFNRAVKRNFERFPDDFMFQLTVHEAKILRCQIGISSKRHGGRRYQPYVFTEHGVAMLSSVLRSTRAVQMNIVIIRAFVRLRELLSDHKDLARRIEDIERRQKRQANRLEGVYSIVRELLEYPLKGNKKFGFKA